MKSVKYGRKRRMVFENNCQECYERDDMKMVQCDSCDEWAHYRCVGVGPEIAKLPWLCRKCKGHTNSRIYSSGSKANNYITQIKKTRFILKNHHLVFYEAINAINPCILKMLTFRKTFRRLGSLIATSRTIICPKITLLSKQY